MLSFTDDKYMYISDTDIKRLYTKANCGINCLFEEFSANCLSFNNNNNNNNYKTSIESISSKGIELRCAT